MQNQSPQNQGMPNVQPMPAPQQAPVQPSSTSVPQQHPTQPQQPVQAPASMPAQPQTQVQQTQTQPQIQQMQQQTQSQQAAPVQQTSASQPTTQQALPQRPQQIRRPSGPSPKSMLLGCLSFFGCSLFLFVAFVIAFVANNSATGENAIARALGVNAAELTNSLITITNLVFGLIAVVTFFGMIIGFARSLAAAKSDRETKSKGTKQGLISFISLILIIAIWVFVFLFLNGRKIDIPTQSTQASVFTTTPEDTLRQIAPFEVTFDATKVPYNPNQVDITFYEWDFGDGGTGTTPVITHTYTSIGQFEAKLTVTARDKRSGENLTQEFTKLITIIGTKLVAEFSMTPESGPAPLTIEFDASASKSPNGQITAYDWDFSGQNTFRDAEGVTTKNTFPREGEYKVSLRVTDNTGQDPVIITKTVTVTGPDVPTPVIDVPTTDGKYYVNQNYTFMGEKTTSPNGLINKYEWDFGDGSPKANTRTATHSFAKEGTYEVILKATDEENKTGEAALKIKVIAKESAPNAVIETIPAQDETKTVLGKVPFEVSFSAEQSVDSDNNIVEYKWDFDGDGTSDSTGLSAKYVYKESGLFNAKLTVIDAAGNESSAVQVVKVEEQGIQARVTSDLVDGTTPLTVVFDASSSSYPGGQITSYEWDFGDGTPKKIDVAKVSHKFVSIGNFTVTVTAKASDGTQSTAKIIISVRPISLTACFVPSLEAGPAPLEIEFDPRCSTGAVAKYSWDFGDGQNSRTRKPIHLFESPGTYRVTLEVTDNENTVDTFTKDILITGAVTQ